MSESQRDEIQELINKNEPWQAELLTQARKVICDTLPDVLEEIKWRKPSNPDGVPVWSLNGIICTGEGFKGKIKLTFAKGAKLDDPRKLFNGSMGGNTMRAIDLFEGDSLDEPGFADLLKKAVELNSSR